MLPYVVQVTNHWCRTASSLRKERPFSVCGLTPTEFSEPLREGTVPTCAEVEDRSSRMMRLYAMAQEVQDS